MKWCLLLFVLCTCATTQTFESKQLICEKFCDKEYHDCIEKQPNFWEYCEKDYNECLEYCY